MLCFPLLAVGDGFSLFNIGDLRSFLGARVQSSFAVFVHDFLELVFCHTHTVYEYTVKAVKKRVDNYACSGNCGIGMFESCALAASLARPTLLSGFGATDSGIEPSGFIPAAWLF